MRLPFTSYIYTIKEIIFFSSKGRRVSGGEGSNIDHEVSAVPLIILKDFDVRVMDIFIRGSDPP
jgi:hypothetical protein